MRPGLDGMYIRLSIPLNLSMLTFPMYLLISIATMKGLNPKTASHFLSKSLTDASGLGRLFHSPSLMIVHTG